MGLCSGGLDSILSGLALREHGIDVEWISFETPFFSSQKALKASKNTGIPLMVKNITPEYIEMLKNPRCGYGHNMNPCPDCHALMFQIAGRIMKENGFDFLFSGEVIGQRPMSQTRHSLRYVEKNSGLEGHIVRPLSIQLLPETLPEKQGWIDRASLYGISGRSRKIQMELARKFGVTDYPHPAGGCLLTDKNFSLRLKDLFDHHKTFNENDLHLLRHGRHFRFFNTIKVIVGRDETDNEAILQYRDPDADILLITPDIPGPAVLIRGGGDPDTVRIAASLCVAYTKTPAGVPAVVWASRHGTDEILRVKGISLEETQKFMI